MSRVGRGWLAGGLALALVAGLARAAPETSRLERLRGEIEAREASARTFRQQAQGYLGELEGVDRELTELRASLRRLRERQRAAEEELKAAERGLAEAGTALEQIEKMLEARLVALYKFGNAGGLPAVYTAGDFQSLLRRGESLTRILAEDRRLFLRHREAQAGWLASRETSQALIAEIREARQATAGREARVRRKLVERRNLVDLLRSRSDREERAAAELREAAERLARALERMPENGHDGDAPGLAAGRTSWPVQGVVRLGFGRQVDPEFGTETLRNGIELEAPPGTAVRAVADGRVLFSGWFRGYGQVVILDHGHEDITVSGFLEELRVEAGERVKSGTVIGTVGETGSLSGPGLYFEIRHAGRPVDPAGWLESRATEGKP